MSIEDRILTRQINEVADELNRLRVSRADKRARIEPIRRRLDSIYRERDEYDNLNYMSIEPEIDIARNRRRFFRNQLFDSHINDMDKIELLKGVDTNTLINLIYDILRIDLDTSVASNYTSARTYRVMRRMNIQENRKHLLELVVRSGRDIISILPELLLRYPNVNRVGIAMLRQLYNERTRAERMILNSLYKSEAISKDVVNTIVKSFVW